MTMSQPRTYPCLLGRLERLEGLQEEDTEPSVRVRRAAPLATTTAETTAESSSGSTTTTTTTTNAGESHGQRSRILLPTFHDGESIRSYTLSFTMEAESCNLPKPQWRSKYFSLLAGSAKTVAYMYLIQNPVASFEDLKAHLENQLERSQDRTARLALWSITRKSDEDLLEFASRVRAGTLAAYGTTYSADQIDDKALDVYLRALSGEVGKRTREMFPTTFSSAIDLSRNFETLGLSTTDAGAGAGAVGAVRQQGRNKQEHGKKGEKKELLCWYCQKNGHKKNDCWTLHPEKAPKGKKGRKREIDKPEEESQ